MVTTVCPFLVVICGGLWLQLRQDQANALDDALDQAQLFAAQVDEHIGNLEHLMMGLSRAVSTRFADTSANDALLRQAKKEMPDFISEIFLFAPDGSIIGVSWNENIRNNVSERAFRRVLAGGHLAIGDVIYTRFSQQWVVTLASRVEDQKCAIARGDRRPAQQTIAAESARPSACPRRREAADRGRDLDSFRDVTDTLGHSVHDQLLVDVGQRFIEATKDRAKVQVFRLSGDEFVLVAPECGGTIRNAEF